MDKDFLLGYTDTVADEGVTLKIDPNDRGGQTWKGISRVMHPECNIWPLIDAHLKSKHGIAIFKADVELEKRVQLFYYNEFWLKLRLNEIKSLPIKLKYFNTAVNVGLVPATKFQQESVQLATTGHVDDLLINSLNQIV
jgi:lysozyme family protein